MSTPHVLASAGRPRLGTPHVLASAAWLCVGTVCALASAGRPEALTRAPA